MWGEMRWDSRAPGFSSAVDLRTMDLATLLSHDWLDDELINAGLDFVMCQLDENSRVRLVNCLFIQMLTTAEACCEYRPCSPSSLDLAIQANKVDELFLPLHVHGNHWTLLHLDLAAFTFSYADSRDPHASPPANTIHLLEWWLRILRPHFSVMKLSLASTPRLTAPVQTDSGSCGIVVLSTIASELLGYEPWTQKSYAVHRLQWFLHLTQTFCDSNPAELEEVNADLDIVLQHKTTSECTELELDDIDFSQDIGRIFASSAAPSSTFATSTPRTPNPVQDSRASCPTIPKSNQCSTARLPRKRLRSPPPSDSDDSDDSDLDSQRYRRRKVGSSGSKSWAYQKALRNTEQTKGSNFKPDLHKLQRFRDKILEDDPHAEFQSKKLRSVRSSACGSWVQMRALYDIKSWIGHHKSDKCKKHKATGLRATSLTEFFKPIGSKSMSTVTVSVPCPGLTRVSDMRVDRYLQHSSTPGGGAPSRAKLAQHIFELSSLLWLDLSKKRRETVLREEKLQYKWRNARSVGAVFATDCNKTVSVQNADMDPLPCSQCTALKHLHTFQVALNRPMPLEENMKFVPKLWRCENLGQIYMKYRGVRKLIEEDLGQSPWLKFGMGVVEGRYTQNTVLLGAIKAMVEKTDRLDKGKALKNMTYSGVFSDFADCLASVSTRAYETFRRHFGGPAVRSLRQRRARLPCFQPGISETNLGLACALLLKLDYHGPVAMSWDDTALEPAISIWQQSKDSACAILGSADGIIEVTEQDNLDAVFEDPKLAKADKLRLFVLTIPLHKVPPIMLAAVARGSKEDAEALARLHFQIVELLHRGGIYPVSLAANGTDVERSTQRLIENSATSFFEYTIPNTVPACTIHLRIVLFNGRPSVSVQDSLHGAKTARNQLFTGARIVVLGNSPSFFAQLREFAMNALAPLFHHDVEKVDKQDDRAAARLFSSPTLSQHLSIYPHRTGLSIYLFILGELIDAWQNRHLVHIERAKMVMRARFFLMAWRSYIDHHPDYALHIQFISRESYDIFLTLCDSLLSLMIVYRKYYPTYPLLPWLHSTEPCEHIFGILRQLKKDFSYVDMLYLEPKLRTLLLGAFGDLTAEQQINQTAGGYYHSYFIAEDLDLHALVQWPTDPELQDASKRAFEEAEQLLGVLGINASSLLKKSCPPAPPQKLKTRQSTHATRGPQTLAEILALYENASFKSDKDEEMFEACSTALVADSVEKSLQIDSLPNSSDQELPAVKNTIEKQRSGLGAVESTSELPYSLSTLNLVDPLTKSLNHIELVKQRTRHQTTFAAKSIRQCQRATSGDRSVLDDPELLSPDSKPKVRSLREELIERIKRIVPDVQSSNTTSGVDRRNKQTLQNVAASKFIHMREEAFLPLQDIHENLYSANVNSLNPLQNGHFVIVWHPKPRKEGLLLGEVVTMYSKSDGRGMNHDWLPSTHSLGVPSYVNIQVYSALSGTTTYSSLACKELGSTTFLRIPRTHIIFSLASSAKSIKKGNLAMPDGTNFETVMLDLFSAGLMETLQGRATQIAQAVKDLKKLLTLKKTALPVPDSETNSEGEDDDALDIRGDGGI
ncbi:hypothetical protein B0H21DRAFT_835847 [Amylocystis lapponica]|nr:hypothetical protein B0H21DRAFT_835847 [Amylocystis lapponica]